MCSRSLLGPFFELEKKPTISDQNKDITSQKTDIAVVLILKELFSEDSAGDMGDVFGGKSSRGGGEGWGHHKPKQRVSYFCEDASDMGVLIGGESSGERRGRRG